MAHIIIEVLGWLGVLMVILGYILITANKVKSDSLPYQLLNLMGALFLAQNAFFNKSYPTVASNFIWFLIAIYGCSRICKKKR